MRHDRVDGTPELHPLSPAGQVQQWGELASGWKTNPTGRRRAVRMLLGLAAAVIVGVALVLALA